MNCNTTHYRANSSSVPGDPTNDISYPATVEGSARSYYYSPVLQTLRRLQPRFSCKAWTYGEIERRQFTRRPPPYLITVSHWAAETFQRDYNLPADRIRVVHNQIDVARFSDLKRATNDELTILFVGQNFRRKGVRPLIEAAARLNRRDFRVIIVGLSEQKAAPYLRLAKRLGIADRVTFRGETRQVQEWFAQADVFCLPSFYDSFGMVVLEAMTAGLPVVISKYVGAREIITPGVEGLIAEPTEIDRPLLELFDRDRRQAMGKAARETALRFAAQNVEIGQVVEELTAKIQAERKS